MIVLKGKPVADSVFESVANELQTWALKNFAMPHLVVVLVGDDPASQVYVEYKQQACKKLNIKSTLIKFPANVSELELKKSLQKLNETPDVDAVLLQLPLPGHLNAKQMTEVILPSKDADGLTQASLGALVAGQAKVTSCTPAGIMEMLKYYKINLENKKIVVVGRSLIVGLPLYHLLLQKNATVSLCHSQTINTKQQIADADLTFVAIGKPHFFKATEFKKGSILFDIGIHRLVNGLCGDVNPAGAEDHLSAMTPVPGGVGPMTIAMLMKNTVSLALANRV